MVSDRGPPFNDKTLTISCLQLFNDLHLGHITSLLHRARARPLTKVSFYLGPDSFCDARDHLPHLGDLQSQPHKVSNEHANALGNDAVLLQLQDERCLYVCACMGAYSSPNCACLLTRRPVDTAL